MVRTGVKAVSCSFLGFCFFLIALGPALASGPKDAAPQTREMNSRLPQGLSDNDREEDAFATRGLIASEPKLDIRTEAGAPVWDMKRYDFLSGRAAAPDTVHPALWRHARRNALHGLFKVTDGIYQVRGYDITNITFIEGKTGYIVVDPLVSAESARAALDLFYRHLPKRPVTAVIYTHSHVDHWGGVKGVVDTESVQAGKVRIIAPVHLTAEAISENIMAGNAMARRAGYMFGSILPKGPKGQIDAGMGKTTSSGTMTFIPPTEEIVKPVQELTIDGIRFIFQLAANTEAPAEMNFYLPDSKALCIAENATGTLHNLLTPRGAQVRDGAAWARSLDEAIDLFCADAEVFFTTHLWPRWGKEKITAYLKQQRDLYKYIHDQTLRLLNQGYTMAECAESIKIPPSLAREWYNREFYGTVNFNVKAVYQRYLGWYDGNPAHLHPLPPVEEARRYVEFMGGAEAVLSNAKGCMKKGDYRWAVQVLNHVVFADPDNREARELQADAMEQLGYRAESPIWRNFYLSGAKELREGVRRDAPARVKGFDVVRSMPLDLFFDVLAIRLNGPKAADKRITVNWTFTDSGQNYALTLKNGVLHHQKRPAAAPDATVALTRRTLDAIASKQATFAGRILAGDVRVEGGMMKFLEMMSCFDEFNAWFDIVTPGERR